MAADLTHCQLNCQAAVARHSEGHPTQQAVLALVAVETSQLVLMLPYPQLMVMAGLLTQAVPLQLH